MDRLTVETGREPADQSDRPAAATGWQAHLKLEFGLAGQATRLLRREHQGPLRVQKPLYPESAEVCHSVIVHPPGGIVSGDQLEIQVSLGTGAQALLTTPGATKWYRSKGQQALQRVHLQLAGNAVLEWLPQENIFFDQSVARMEHSVALAAGARYLGGEILCFGRTGAGENYRQGSLAQAIRIYREQQLIWVEQGQLLADSAARRSPLVLQEFSVSAVLLACGPAAMDAAGISQLRELAGAAASGLDPLSLSGFSQQRGVLCGRFAGHSSEAARAWLLAAWAVLRPQIIGRAAQVPRIWQT